MSEKGTCDLCNQDIEQDQGYVFYSVTVIKTPSAGNDPTGLMHICDGCTERYITDELTDYTLNWLEKERDTNKPFFLYFSHKAVHANFDPAERHRDQALLMTGGAPRLEKRTLRRLEGVEEVELTPGRPPPAGPP